MGKLERLHVKKLAELGLVNSFHYHNHCTLRRSGPQQGKIHTMVVKSFNDQEPSPCSVLGTVLGAGDAKRNKHAMVPVFKKFLVESRQTNNYTDYTATC